MAAALVVLMCLTVGLGAQEPEWLPWLEAESPDSRIGQLQFKATRPCPNGGMTMKSTAYAFAEPVVITRTYLWMGTHFGIPYPVVDLHATIFASRPWGFVLSALGMDRYAPPNGVHDKERTHRHPLKAGDMVSVEVSCAPVIWWLGSGITASVIIDYEKVR